VAVAFILLSALYCFCNVNMKSNDNYFVGFPAVWNVVALYLYVLDLEPGVTFALIAIFAVMTFTTAKFVHPFRVPHLMPMNIAMTAVWMISSLMLVLRQPETPLVLMVPWVVSSAWFAGICAWRTVRDYTQSR
jgi:phosphatidylcholine synthase